MSPASRIAPAGLRRLIVPASDAFRLKSIFITSTSQKSPPFDTCAPSSTRYRVSLPPYGAASTDGSFSFSRTTTLPSSVTRVRSPGSDSKWKLCLTPPKVQT